MRTIQTEKKIRISRKTVSRLQNDFIQKIGKPEQNQDCPWSASGSCTTNCCGGF